MKRYPKYRDTGIEWLGEVPVHWAMKPLKFLLKDGQEGIRIGPFGSSLKSEFIKNAGLKVYGQENIINDDFTAGSRFIDRDKFDELSAYEIFPGDVIVTMMGTTGKSKVVPKGIRRGIMDSHLIRMRTNGETMPEFVSMLLNDSHYLYTQLKQNSKGSIMEGLNSSIIKSLLIANPPATEQYPISSYLDRKTQQIDELIEKKRRMIELLKEERAAVINTAVTKGLDPKAKMKDSGIEWLGKVPEKWKTAKLRYYSDFVTSGSRNWAQYVSDEGAVFLRITNLFRDSIDLKLESIQRVIPPDDSEGNRTRVQEDDVLMSITADIGSIGLVPADFEEAYVNQHIALIRLSKNRGVNARWVAYCLMSTVGKTQTEMAMYGGTKQGLSLEDVKDTCVLIPPEEEQAAIVRRIDKRITAIDTLGDKENRAIEHLQEYRTALISEVVTGKIDVRSEVPA